MSYLMKLRLAKVGVIAWGDSHLRHSSKDDARPAASYSEADRLFKKHFPVGKHTESRAWGGLTLDTVLFDKDSGKICDKKSRLFIRKTKQRDKVRDFVAASKARVAVMECGSNSIFAFTTDDENFVFPTDSGSINKWNKVPSNWKINPRFNKTNYFSTTAVCHIKKRVQTYVENLVQIYKNSDVEFVFHVSILERVYKPTHVLRNCNLYFAYANFFLKRELNKLNGVDLSDRVMNRAGKSISWHFINVARQFYKAKDQESLFMKWERDNYTKNRYLIHRSREAMDEIIGMCMAELYDTLVGVGAFDDVKVDSSVHS